MNFAISSAISANGVCNMKPTSKYTPTCLGVIKFSNNSFLILNRQNGIKMATAVMTPGTYFLRLYFAQHALFHSQGIHQRLIRQRILWAVFR